MSHYPNILPAMVRPRNLQVGAYYAIALFMTKTEGWPEPIQHLGIGGAAIFGDLSWLWYLLYMILSVLQRVKMKVMHVISYHMIHRSSMHTLKFRWNVSFVVMQKTRRGWPRNTATGWLSSATASFAGCILYKLERRPGDGEKRMGAFQLAPSCWRPWDYHQKLSKTRGCYYMLLCVIYLHCFLP